MIILGIETSCDETAVCIIDANKDQVKVLGNQLYSQIELHKQYGGVFPMMAKREHQKNLVPLFEKCLEEAGLKKTNIDSTDSKESADKLNNLKSILEKEQELFEQFSKLINEIQKPEIDAIAVTNGPGLEPALWVGVNFAKAISEVWGIPVIPTNHMEGHIVISSLIPDELTPKTYNLKPISYPAIALLISGGHTQLVLIKDSLEYEIIGNTRDDAAGEAFDKVARILGLPYPGGPQISKYADQFKISNITPTIKLPRPMVHSNDLDFSFSGLKTSVLYFVQKLPELTETIKQEIASEFQNAVIDVLTIKTKKAIEKFGAKTLIIGGGVSANKSIRESFKKTSEELGIDFLIPEVSASTDNAMMIAVAGYIRNKKFEAKSIKSEFKASGNLSL